MKEKTTKIKRMLGLTVSAVMLLSFPTMNATATDSVPTSEVYTIDAQNSKVYVPHNVYMGDFLRAVNSYGSVKTLVDKSGNVVLCGTVESGMKLKIGNTEYEIETNLYSLQDKIKDFAENEEIFDFNSDVDGQNLSKAISTSEKMSKIFNEGKNGTITQTGTYLKVTKRTDAENGDYLEIKTNSQRMLNLTTAYFEDYTEIYPTAENIVTEMNAVVSVAESDTNTGQLTMGHVFSVNNNGNTENVALSQETGLGKIEDSYTKNTNTYNVELYNSDFAGFRGGGYFNMGGDYKSNTAASNDIILKKTAYSNDEMLKLKQLIKVGEKGATSFDVAGVYFNDELLTGYTRFSRYSGKTEFNIPLAENVTLNRISAGILGVGVNSDNANSPTYGTESILKIYDFKIYPAESEKTAATHVNLATSNDAEKNGYTCVYKPASVSGVLPNTTVKELIDSLVFPSCTYSRVSANNDKAKTDYYLSDSYVITGANCSGLYLHVGKPGDSSTNKGYSINLATIDPATTTVNGAVLTAERKCSNTVLGVFVFAAYNEAGKMLEIKTTTASVDGVRSVSFTTSASEIATVKSFVFNNTTTLRPVVDDTAVAASDN